jgi:glycosyltransferase involved in cell wall biosynthesis
MLQMRKIAIIGTVGLPAKYGGFETLAEYLTKYLFSEYDISVYCSAKSYDVELSTYNGAKLKYINLKANGIQSIPYDIISIIRACRTADTLLILGVSGCIILPIIKQLSSKKLVVNIDGIEWKRNKWNKYAKWFLKFSEKQAVNYADIIVTDNKAIEDYVQDEYGKKSELIAYGADHVKKLPIDEDLSQEFSFLQDKYAFTVCRIEPENNLHVIIEAMSQQTKLPLVVIGNWNASLYGQELREKYSSYKHIYLLDPIYEQDKLNKFRSNCYIYLHGHSAGGTNPSLVEAMHLKLPIFAFDVVYNGKTTEHQAKYFSSSEELLKLIENSNEISLEEIGNKMYEISEKRYRWDIIAKQYAKLF